MKFFILKMNKTPIFNERFVITHKLGYLTAEGTFTSDLEQASKFMDVNTAHKAVDHLAKGNKHEWDVVSVKVQSKYLFSYSA